MKREVSGPLGQSIRCLMFSYDFNVLIFNVLLQQKGHQI